MKSPHSYSRIIKPGSWSLIRFVVLHTPSIYEIPVYSLLLCDSNPFSPFTLVIQILPEP